jgi:diaminopimelate decarboxylase
MENEFLTCVMCHVGSQGMPLELMVEGAVRITEFADEIDRACGKRRIDVIDIGGGLSVDYLKDVRPKFDEYAEMLHSKCKSLFQSERKVLTEFGKSVIAKTAAIVAKVEDVLHPFHADPDVDHSIAITHAGADLMLRTAYCPDKFSHRLSLLSEDLILKSACSSSSSISSSSSSSSSSVTVAGPLCFSGDIIGDNLNLPPPKAGDWLVVSDAGANTLSLFSRHCSRQSPAVFGFSQSTKLVGSGSTQTLSVSSNFVKIRSKESEDDIYQFWG